MRASHGHGAEADPAERRFALADVFGGQHPLGIPEDRYIAALFTMTATMMGEKA